MYINPGSVLKDLIIFMALIFLLSILLKRFDTYVSLHKESFVHALDESFFEVIKVMQRHAGIAYQAVHLHTIASEDIQLKRHIKTMHRLLDDIEKKYTHNAASLALLGPIGTTSILLKEKRLSDHLIKAGCVINDVFAVLLDKNELSAEKKQHIGLDEIIKLNSIYAKEVQKIL